ncbi:MAG: alkaline phosphatase family protein [Gemmatimonadales bacterium]
MPRWLLVTSAIVVAGLLGLAGLLLYKGTPLSEILSLLTADAVVQLREEMRPARADGQRVLVVALDGVGAEAFREAVGSGGMPRVAALLGAALDGADGLYAHGSAPNGVLSILPSTTFAAWTTTYTGVGVAEHGVPGNEWFDRESLTFVAPAPVSVHENGDALRVYSDSLMHRWIAVPTLFERANVRSYVTLAAQYRGADLLVRPDAGTFADLVAAFTAGIVADEATREPYSALDIEAVDQTLEAIEEHGLADLQIVYFPGVDLFTHVSDAAIPDQKRYLAEVIDSAVGRLLDAYRARGALDSTYVLFISDHGHTPSLADEQHALGAGGDGEPADALVAAGFRVRPFELETEDDSFQAVLAYQGAIAYVHLADRSTCPGEGDRCDWLAPPRLEEDILPVVRAFAEAGRTGAGASKLQGAIDLIFARESHGVEPAGPFQVWDGEALVPVATYLAAHPRPDLLDLERRLDALAVGRYGHRAGDVLILSRYREDDPESDRYYFSASYRSWHGSPSRQDSEIVFAVARPASTGAALRDRVHAVVGATPSQLDVTALILDLLGR